MNRKLLAVATAAGLTLAATASAADPHIATVTVFDDHYIVGARAHGDLDKAENDIRARKPEVIRMEICGSYSSIAVMALGHRFRDMPLDMVPVPGDDARCQRPALRPVAATSSASPTGIDKSSVDRYWKEMLP